jgi:hypothetical protein
METWIFRRMVGAEDEVAAQVRGPSMFRLISSMSCVVENCSKASRGGRQSR